MREHLNVVDGCLRVVCAGGSRDTFLVKADEKMHEEDFAFAIDTKHNRPCHVHVHGTPYDVAS